MPFMYRGGGVTLASDLGDISSGLPDEVKKALDAEAEKMADDARSRVPVDTGELRDSIRVVQSNEPGKIGFRVEATARADSGRYEPPYAIMVEFGTRAKPKRPWTTPAQPFLTPAFFDAEQGVVDAVEAAIKDASNV